jgi:dipeptidyl aminopeptidase/acylaminoacyl peptidase
VRIESVTLEVDGINIAGQLYLPGSDISYPTVCACHGIPAGAPDPADRGYASLAEKIAPHGFAVLIFNFRGAGVSGGNLDILGWTRDLEAVIDYLCALPQVDNSRLSLLGFSAGAAVSVYVAAGDRRVSAVVACACPAEFNIFVKGDNPRSLIDHFRSIGAIRDDSYPAFPQEWLNGFELVKPIGCIAQISPRPLLLVHGSQDETVNVSHARRLYAQAGEPKQLAIVEGAGHRLRRDERAMDIVIDWLKALNPPSV